MTLAVSYSSALAVNPSVPAKTVGELVALIKANPGKYSFASPGFGTPTHLLGEQLRVALGLDLVHVPFAGSGPATASMVAGHTPIATPSACIRVAISEWTLKNRNVAGSIMKTSKQLHY